jgi:hypothetical protein
MSADAALELEPAPTELSVRSISPAQAVVDRGMGDHRGHCNECQANGDDLAEAAAWDWVGDHRCGVETARDGDQEL